jgi:uncharacterized protein (TIGR00251 family)
MLAELKKKLGEKKTLYLKIKAIPGAPKTEVKNIMADGTVKIAVAAAPEKGRANIVLINFLAEKFGAFKNNVVIVSGAAERTKLVKIEKK